MTHFSINPKQSAIKNTYLMTKFNVNELLKSKKGCYGWLLFFLETNYTYLQQLKLESKRDSQLYTIFRIRRHTKDSITSRVGGRSDYSPLLVKSSFFTDRTKILIRPLL